MCFSLLGSLFNSLCARWEVFFHLSSGDDLLSLLNKIFRLSWISLRDTGGICFTKKVEKDFPITATSVGWKKCLDTSAFARPYHGELISHCHGRYGFCSFSMVLDQMMNFVIMKWMKCLSICQVRTSNIS